MKGYAKSVIGKRESQQDSFLLLDDRQLYAVADGVGGGVRGDVASKMAVDYLEKEVHKPHDMVEVFRKAQKAVYKDAMDTVGSPMMGTTLTAVCCQSGNLHICHVGDSRLYLLKDDCLQQLTEDMEHYDDTIKGTVLSSYLGIPEDIYPLTILEKQFPCDPGASFLLCSDGLYRQMPEPRMVEIIKQNQDNLDQIPNILCEEASLQEGSDNVTIVYVT